jgi:hypothetical protein
MMNNFDKHLLPGCHQGDDPELDCPNANCTGYLNLYLYNNNNNPAYLQCSNKHNPIPSLRCEQATIFSRRPGMCPYCHKEIRFKDIITPGWEHDWIHLACAYKNTQPEHRDRCRRIPILQRWHERLHSSSLHEGQEGKLFCCPRH